MDAEAKSFHAVTEVLPSPENIQHARSQLIKTLPGKGSGLDQIQKHLQNDLVPAFDRHNKTPNYYGFVTGGTTPASLLADHIAVDNDQSLMVHLPKDSISVEAEDCALRMLCQLLDFEPERWPHRTFTTGATASNVLGLACGREYVIRRAAEVNGGEVVSVADYGLPEAMRRAGIENMQILSEVPHSSLRKAASIVGLGRASVRNVGLANAAHRFDFEALEAALEEPRTASIVSISCSEINTGFFATSGDDMQRIRQLCDQYGAWIHVDAAFGLLARVLPQTPEYEVLTQGVKDLHLADSITGDGHKLLNVPYDCGFFFSRHLDLGTAVFQNTNAAYINSNAAATSSGTPSIPSPLNIGIENSRRFRALPVYASLTAYGRNGYRDMMERQISLARAIAKYIDNSVHCELLPKGNSIDNIYIIVLFQAKDENINDELVQRINATRKIYVSGTQWDGRPAARFAVASWQVQVEREMATIKEVLESACT
ncbi:uncharacterized protein LTR77_002975 [Saxophila tyrrhenica]|uniref:Tyrosine decarboxylase n=1 Tax=Saxophila tyrrhenica TaxID=1690608 RepID=A0AAV9PGY5_9PEZI|nr:hypothetical protein LTR77_002975 [Saxophila tyrrhenica]